MSVKCSQAVWQSRLPSHLKLTALALADFADDEGGSIFPSVDTLAKMTGRTERQERSNLSTLCGLGILIAETPRIGGQGSDDALSAEPRRARRGAGVRPCASARGVIRAAL